MACHRNKITKRRYRASFALGVDNEYARLDMPKECTAVLKFGFIVFPAFSSITCEIF